MATRVLADLGVDTAAVDRELGQARAFQSSHLGAEHLLLGILRVADSKPRGSLHKALGTLGLDHPTTRQQIQSRPGRAPA